MRPVVPVLPIVRLLLAQSTRNTPGGCAERRCSFTPNYDCADHTASSVRLQHSFLPFSCLGQDGSLYCLWHVYNLNHFVEVQTPTTDVDLRGSRLCDQCTSGNIEETHKITAKDSSTHSAKIFDTMVTRQLHHKGTANFLYHARWLTRYAATYRTGGWEAYAW